MGKTLRTTSTTRQGLTNTQQNSASETPFTLESNFLPTSITLEAPPRGYVPIDLGDSPFFVPPNQGSELPNPSDYSLSSSFASFEIEEISISGCHICVTFGYAIGFVKFPSTILCYIAPECRDFRWRPQTFSGCIDRSNYEKFYDYLISDFNAYTLPQITNIPPSCERLTKIPEGDGTKFIRIEIYWKNITDTLIDEKGRPLFRRRSPENNEFLWRRVIARNNFRLVERIPQSGLRRRGVFPDQGPNYSNTIIILGGQYFTDKYINSDGVTVFVPQSDREFDVQVIFYNNEKSYSSFTYGERQIKIFVDGILNETPEDLPFNPKTPMPRCCENPTIERLLRRIDQRVGCDDFPVKVPQSLLTDRGNNTIAIQNLPQLITWLTKQIDSLVGELPGEIEIQDIDPKTEGNQTKKFKFPTLSDLMLEIAGLVINNKINTESALVAALNTMVEAGQIKNTAIANHHAIQAILDYLSPNLAQSVVDVPCTFSPGETELHKLLKPTTVPVKIVELNSKTDLQDDLEDLKRFAAQWRAQNYRQIKLNGNEAEQIKNFIRNAKSILSGEDPQTPGENNNNRSDFSSFIEQTERGFTDASGITDTTNPYGRPFTQRPRIRELGDTSDRGTEGN